MQRIATDTRDQDLFGSGLDGFTNGDPGVPTPPTALDEVWFNNVQEELCRIVTAYGGTLDEANFTQVAGAVREAALSTSQRRDSTLDYAIYAPTYTFTSLAVSSLASFDYVVNGALYHTESVAVPALTANRDHYVDIDSAGTVTIQVVTNGASEPAQGSGVARVAIVVTNAGFSSYTAHSSVGYRVGSIRVSSSSGLAEMTPYTTGAGVANIGSATRRFSELHADAHYSYATSSAFTHERISVHSFASSAQVEVPMVVLADFLGEEGCCFVKGTASVRTTADVEDSFGAEFQVMVTTLLSGADTGFWTPATPPIVEIHGDNAVSDGADIEFAHVGTGIVLRITAPAGSGCQATVSVARNFNIDA